MRQHVSTVSAGRVSTARLTVCMLVALATFVGGAAVVSGAAATTPEARGQAAPAGDWCRLGRDEVTRVLNDARRQNGRTLLQANVKLTYAAQIQADDNMRARQRSTVGALAAVDRMEYRYRSLRPLAMIGADSGSQIASRILADPARRAIALTKAFGEIGVGCAYSAQANEYYWIIDLAQSEEAWCDGYRAPMLKAVNAERAKAGLAPVRYDARLNQSAQAHSMRMADTLVFSHDGFGDDIKATGYPEGWWAENIAAGPMRVSHVMGAWMNSPGHRDNIMYPAARDFGLGCAYTTEGYHSYWTQHFGAY